MDILVGDLAKLFGISSQTLHYYEEKQIMHPKRGILNSYRSYETSDLSRLGAIKKHRNAEFALDKSVEIYDKATELQIITEYNKQKKLLWKEIENKQFLLRQFDEYLSSYMRYKETGDTVHIEEMGDYLRFESSLGQIIVQDKTTRDEAAPWFSNIFHTSGSQMFSIDDKSNKIISSTNGMVASSETAKFLNLTLTKNVKVIKGGKFATSFMNTDIEEDFEKAIYKCMKYIGDNNLKIRGNPFTKTILIFKNLRDERKVIEQVLVPIK